MHVKGDAKLEFVRNGKKCNMKFLDADVKKPLASVCLGRKIRRIPMSKRYGVFVVQLDAQASENATKMVSLDESNKNSVVRRLA